MEKNTKLKGKKDKSKGITLIALVITIIVLLILVAVSIATLTGENGILTKANTAKTETTIAEEKEQIQLAYMTALTKKNYNGEITVDELNNELKKLNEEATVREENNSFIVTFSKTGNSYMIDGKGNVTGSINQGGNVPNPSVPTIETEKGKTFDINTEIQDKYGNKLTIPEGFKITKDSPDDVTGGVVIEDVSNPATERSQFVWIPVGTIYTNKERTERKTIPLGRYDFASDGTATTYSGSYKEEDARDTANLLNYGNTVAKDIEGFKTSVDKNGGYYIGRYEARTVKERNTGTDNIALGKLTIKANEYVYNWVTQQQAAELSREMYKENKKFTSDLMNSYAWDTAIAYIQTFGQSDYSVQKSLNISFANTGTNNLTDRTQQDEQCNIWDMASNSLEWTTETSNISAGPCVGRGGGCNFSNTSTSFRSCDRNNPYGNYSFRPILYL